MSIDLARQEIQKQKELPNLSPDIQRILTACQDPDLTQQDLAKTLGESPTISARLLGLANSAFFGQQGRVHSLPYAISVLGFVTVRSIAVGLALSGVFRTERCPHFRSDRYWASAVLTALMSSELNPYLNKDIRPNGDSVYMAGLLHNIGLPTLAHIYPEQMDNALAAYEANPARRLGEHIRDKLDADHYQAGMWLGVKWHLPEDILHSMENHYDSQYRGKGWPLALLEGLCARWANRILDGDEEINFEPEALAALGLPAAKVEAQWAKMRDKLDAIKEMSELFTKG